MSGTIAVTFDDRWSTASWAYHWVLDYLIEHVADPEVTAQLREIDENNLGWVGLYDFPEPTRSEMLGILADEIVPDAEQRLLPGKPERQGALDILREVQALALKHRSRS